MSRAVPPDKHPSSETLVSWALGALPTSEARKLVRHSLRCGRCDGLAKASVVLVRAASPDLFESVPGPARRRAAAAFASLRTPAATGRMPPGTGRMRVVLFPPISATGPAVASVRGEAGEKRCRLDAGDHRIDLEWMFDGSGWTSRGRFEGESRGTALEVEPRTGRSRRIRPGVRGFFGPIHLASPGLRVRLVTPSRAYRSPWLPLAPKDTPSRSRKPGR